MDIMAKYPTTNGLYPTVWSVNGARPANRMFQINLVCARCNGSTLVDKFSVGAFADSGYEYMLKQYLLTAKSEPKVRDMCT